MQRLEVSERIELAEVLTLPNEAAVQWLQNHADNSSLSKRAKDIATYCFSRRRDNRLNLSVAKYGTHFITLQKLLEKGNKLIRLAALSNRHVGPAENIANNDLYFLTMDDVYQLIEKYSPSSQEVATLFQNPNINRSAAADIVEKFINEDDYETLLELVIYFVKNPFLAKVRDETFLDGYDQYEFYRVNFALIDLLNTAPINTTWAFLLDVMLSKTHRNFSPNIDPNKLLDRWTDEEAEAGNQDHTFPDLRENITATLIANNHSEDIKSIATIEHKDKSVRLGLYGEVRPEKLFTNIIHQKEFSYPYFDKINSKNLEPSQKTVAEIIKKCFKQDGNDFIDRLLDNDHFWRTEATRNLLEDLSWHLADDEHGDMMLPNSFRAIRSRYLKSHPEYFEDETRVERQGSGSIQDRMDALTEHLIVRDQKISDFIDQQDQWPVENQIEDLTEYLVLTNSKLDAIIESVTNVEDLVNSLSKLLWVVLILLLASLFF